MQIENYTIIAWLDTISRITGLLMTSDELEANDYKLIDEKVVEILQQMEVFKNDYNLSADRPFIHAKNSIAYIHDMLKQRYVEPNVFKSAIDLEGLAALARITTENMNKRLDEQDE